MRNDSAKRALRIGYGLVPIIAGADKFTNLLADWQQYLSPAVKRALPVDGRTFMRLVGMVEITAGFLVLSRTRLGAWTVAGWLTAITGNLLSTGKYLDIAARDALLAVGAAALGMLSSPAQKAAELPPSRVRDSYSSAVPFSVH